MSLHDLLLGNWILLGSVAPDALIHARLQAHYALQLAAAPGATQLPKRDDDSQGTTEWLDRLQAFVGQPLPGGLCAALRPRDLHLMLVDKDGLELAGTSLAGRTLEDGLEWLRGAIREQAGMARPPRLNLPGHELPEHKLAHGGKFEVDAAALGELARWFANADRVFQFMASREKQATAVYCWPHHFDAALVITLGKGRTIGVGLSPGDEHYRQPYFYVSPRPTPSTRRLPALGSGGTWHRKGWTGAVLTASKLVSARGAQRQVSVTTEFLASAINASRALLK
jgi:hypothetical protein